MGEPPCDELGAEMALDVLEAELAAELPAHMRAFARAHADDRAPPGAPDVCRRPATLRLVQTAFAFDTLVDRALALARLIAPLAIEDDLAVAEARAAAPSWPGLVTLSNARDAAARKRFGMNAIELVHRLQGTYVSPRTTAAVEAVVVEDSRRFESVSGYRLDDTIDDSSIYELAEAWEAGSRTPVPDDRQTDRMPTRFARLAAWHAQEAPVDQTAILDAWHAIAARLGVTGSVRIDRLRTPSGSAARPGGAGACDRSETAKPRTFVIVPQSEVIVVVPHTIDTPALRFAVLHELGHAAIALALRPGIPRVLDEAVASYVARLAEPPSFLPPRWVSELATEARRRRSALATMLDDVERALPIVPDPPPSKTPPWALWHDAGAQASYVAAEAIADRLHAQLGPTPPRGQFARVLAAERDRIDRATRI